MEVNKVVAQYQNPPKKQDAKKRAEVKKNKEKLQAYKAYENLSVGYSTSLFDVRI